MEDKKVGVVILNWNGRKLLEEFLPSVYRYTDPSIADIILADNGSTDESIAYVKSNFPEVTIIAMPSNEGFAEGYNIALKQLDYEYFVLLNSDVEVTLGWLDPMLSYADSLSMVAAIQPKILSYRNKTEFEHAGASGGFIDSYGFPFCRGRLFDTVEQDEGQYDRPVPIFWASGACLFIRSKDFFEAGGLDKHFFAHMEEIDLCWRLQRMGRMVMCLPQSVVYHKGGATLDVKNPRKTYLNFRNNLLMLYKNLPEQNRDQLIWKRKALDGIAGVKFALTFNWANVKAIYRAHKDAKEMIETIYREEADSFPKIDVISQQICYRKSIVFDYYIKRIRTFVELTKNKK